MEIECSKCGETITIRGIGRKPLNIAVINVYDTLKNYRSVVTAANKLGCSRAYIYKILKTEGLKPEDVIKGKKLSKTTKEVTRGRAYSPPTIHH